MLSNGVCLYVKRECVYVSHTLYESTKREDNYISNRHTQSLDGVVVNALAYEVGRRGIEAI